MIGAKIAIRAQYLLIAIAVITFDQITKWVVSRNVALNDLTPVIRGFFGISHVHNRGAAFSLFAGHNSLIASRGLMIFSALVAIILIVTLWRMGNATASRGGVAFALILGGAVGNLIDRIRLGSVVDFLAFDFGRYHWPDFNVADSAIVCGAALLVLDVMMERKNS